MAGVFQTELLKIENENVFFNERMFGRLGYGFLYAFFGVGFGLLFTFAVYLKFKYFGAEMMAFFAVFGFVFLGVLSLLSFAARKLISAKSLAHSEATSETAKLNSDVVEALNPGDPVEAGSVIENTTELLQPVREFRKDDKTLG